MTTIRTALDAVAFAAPLVVCAAFLASVWMMRPNGRRWQITAASLRRADMPAPAWVLAWAIFAFSMLPVFDLLMECGTFDRIDQAGREVAS